MNKIISYLRGWINLDYSLPPEDDKLKTGIDWFGAFPFIPFHLMCFGVIWTGWSPFALWFAFGFYIVRMFSITGFYHRYFAHQAFTANRFFSFIFAILGCTAIQNGPLWWAAIHRHHHLYADTEKDIHSPKFRGFWWSHAGWVLSFENRRTRIEYLKDWLKFPELIFIDKFASVIPVIVGGLVFLLGHYLAIYTPELKTNGPQLLVWGFFISTIATSQAVFSINSIDHMYGSIRYELENTSRNNVLMAILTLGEGWHNNHHHYPVTAKAGFYWWEIDITYYILVLLSWVGVVKNLRPLPDHIRDMNHVKNAS